MEMYVRVGGEPSVVFLMSAVIVEDDVNFLVSGNVRHDLIEEGLERFCWPGPPAEQVVEDGGGAQVIQDLFEGA